MIMLPFKGKLVIISAPSGAGKTTIVKYLLSTDLNLEFSISAATRKPRTGETNGKDYYFMSAAEFKQKIGNNEFVEWEEVYHDHFYGTLKNEIERIWSKGNHVLFDVDVKGGIKLKKISGNKAISIFIMPPSVEELENRLLSRGTDDLSKINTRVRKAVEEMELANQFDTIVVNRMLEEAEEEIYKIVSGFLGS